MEAQLGQPGDSLLVGLRSGRSLEEDRVLTCESTVCPCPYESWRTTTNQFLRAILRLLSKYVQRLNEMVSIIRMRVHNFDLPAL